MTDTTTTVTPAARPETRTVYTLANGQTAMFLSPGEVSSLTSAELKTKKSDEATSLSAGLLIAAVVGSILLTAFGIIAGLLAWNANGAISSFAAGILAWVFGGVSYFYITHSKGRKEFMELTGLKLKDTSTLQGRLFWRLAHYTGYLVMPLALVAVWWPNVIGGMLVGIMYMAVYASVLAMANSQAPIAKRVSLAVFKKYGSAGMYETEEDFELRMIRVGAVESKVDYDSVTISI